jgi:hypothetical protein
MCATAAPHWLAFAQRVVGSIRRAHIAMPARQDSMNRSDIEGLVDRASRAGRGRARVTAT